MCEGSGSEAYVLIPFFVYSAQLLETSGIQIRADAESDAVTKVSMILECIHERLMDIEVLVDMKRVKLEQCIHLLQFESEANQVCHIAAAVELLHCVEWLPLFCCIVLVKESQYPAYSHSWFSYVPHKAAMQ